MSVDVVAAENRMSMSAKASLIHTDSQFEPANLESAMHLSQLLAQSKLIPTHFQGKAADVLIVLMMAKAYRLPAILMLQESHVINGKHGLSALMLQALAMKVPDCELFRIIEATDTRATIEVKRRSWSDSQKISYTMEEARKAGLLSKGGAWATNPVAMLIARARSRAARTYFPEIALYSVEELRDGDIIVPEAVQTEATGFQGALQKAKRVSAAKALPAEPITFAPEPRGFPEAEIGSGIPATVGTEREGAAIIDLDAEPEIPAHVAEAVLPGREPGEDDEPEDVGALFGYPKPPVETSDRAPRGRGRR